MSTVAELSIFPMDKGESVSKYVAKAVGIIEKCGLAHQTGPMGTSMEGEMKDVMAVASKCMQVMQEDCDRIYMILNVDYRKGKNSRLTGKVESIKKHLKS